MEASHMSIYASWRTEKSILQIIRRDFDGQEKERWSADERALEQYAQGGNPFKDPVDRTKASSAPFAINVTWVLGYSGRAHALAMKSLFSSKSGDWLLQYRTFTAVQFWRRTLDHHVLQFDLSFSHAMESISDCLYLGWLDKTELLVKEVHAAYSAKRVREVTEGYSQPLYFLLREAYVQKNLPQGTLDLNKIKSNFSTFDHLTPSGIAVSTKPLDTAATTYQQSSAISHTINKYIDDIVNFKQDGVGANIINSNSLTGRKLHIAIPAGTTADQFAAIARSIEYGKANSVDVILTKVK